MLQQPFFTVQQNNGLVLPSSISGLQLWLESNSNIVLGGSNVLSWTDKTSGIVYTQATPANRPPYLTNELNGLPVVNFTSSPITLLGGSSALLNNATGATAFIVFRPNALPASNVPVFYISTGTNAGSTRFALQITAGQKMVLAGRRLDADGLATLTSLTNFSTSNYQIVCIDYNPVNTTANIFYNNPTTADINTTTFSTAGSNMSATNGLQTSLGSANSGNFSNVRIADTLLYNRLLTSTERQNVFAYLNDRFKVY